MDDTPQARIRWFHLTPGRVVIALLAVEGLLWASQRFGWIAWHKGYAVLTALAVVSVVMLLMFLWFGVALLFRRRFQFSIRSLLVLVVAVAVPCSWFATEVRRAERQRHAVETILLADGSVSYDFAPHTSILAERREFFRDAILDAIPDGGLNIVDWTFDALGVDYSRRVETVNLGMIYPVSGFSNGYGPVPPPYGRGSDELLSELRSLPDVQRLTVAGPRVTDAGLEHLAALTELAELKLYGTHVTDAGVAKLQQALPNCKITR